MLLISIQNGLIYRQWVVCRSYSLMKHNDPFTMTCALNVFTLLPTSLLLGNISARNLPHKT